MHHRPCTTLPSDESGVNGNQPRMRTDGFKMGLEVDDYEIERLRAELQQESQMR